MLQLSSFIILQLNKNISTHEITRPINIIKSKYNFKDSVIFSRANCKPRKNNFLNS